MEVLNKFRGELKLNSAELEEELDDDETVSTFQIKENGCAEETDELVLGSFWGA